MQSCAVINVRAVDAKEKEAGWRNYRVPFKVYTESKIETEVIKRTGRKQKRGEYKSEGGSARLKCKIKT